MSLPSPNLDDRRFQDIVDEAKRRIPRHCPDWTDHNVSDPGVALIELFAWMTEMTLYRLNQVPDRMYVKFLELVGIELFSAVPARVDLLFNLTAPRAEPVRIPAGTQVSTERSSDGEAVVFLTDDELQIVAPQLIACLTHTDDRFTDHWDDLRREASSVRLFPTLRPDEAVYFGFADSAAGNLLRLEVKTGPEGAGVDPRRPPRVWEAWDGREWQNVRILDDTSAGFNSPGEVTLLLPPRHKPLALGTRRAHWVRCRLIQAAPGQPDYRNPPRLESLQALSIGGAVAAHHAEPAPAELLGTSTGRPGQVFTVRRAPVLPRKADETVRVVPPRHDRGSPPEEEVWSEVADLSDATIDDRVFTWSSANGEIRFGPQVFDREGRARQHGAVPQEDAQIYVTGYRYGGGRRGNVAANRLTVLHTSIPFVANVTNLDPATGGVDAESVENAKVRGPLYLRWERLLVPTSQPPPPSRPAVPTIAYVMFTSGSTGVPKGAAIRRTSLACLAAWGRGLLDLGPDSTVGQLAGVGFDASIWEVWPAWTAGARVVVAPAHVRFDPPALLDWLGEARVDATFLATPLAEMVMTLDPPRSLRLRLLTVGGDRLRPVPGPLPYRVLNMYGPTECTVIATAGHVTPGAAAVPSIGVPLPYAYARVVGDDGTPTPDGEPGELWIGGQGVGAGYLFQPEESAARFVPDPYTDAGRIVYRTGDLVRRGVDGSFAFIGRLDRQVKLAGARIELGEIEAVAQRCAGIEVASAAVVGPPEERHLVVFAVLRAGHDADTVAADLRRRLPSQARGLRLRPVARLPLTGNGKVDRARLETELTAAARVQEGHVAGTDA
ncbi:hypothetical protein GCM10009558_060060 [Virgisporangium aurantiacum]